MEQPFVFDYTCDDCATPFCERILVMNLALDYEDSQYCLSCLCKKEELANEEALYTWVLDYVMARDCFKSPWDKFSPLNCPRSLEGSCYCPQPPLASTGT
jgi:hypothetical protein